jgi:hypothetical protein
MVFSNSIRFFKSYNFVEQRQDPSKMGFCFSDRNTKATQMLNRNGKIRNIAKCQFPQNKNFLNSFYRHGKCQIT